MTNLDVALYAPASLFCVQNFFRILTILNFISNHCRCRRGQTYYLQFSVFKNDFFDLIELRVYCVNKQKLHL